MYNLKPIGQIFKDKEIEDFFNLRDGKCRLPETSVSNHHYTPRNMPEDGRSHSLRSGSLKSCIFLFALFSDAFKLNITVDGTVLILE